MEQLFVPPFNPFAITPVLLSELDKEDFIVPSKQPRSEPPVSELEDKPLLLQKVLVWDLKPQEWVLPPLNPLVW